MELVQKIIYGFIIVVFGAIMVGVIATESNNKTNPSAVASETLSIASARLAGGALNATYPLTIANAPTGWKSTDCPITNFVLKNSTGATMTVTTNYVFTASTGTVTLVNVVPLNTSTSNSTTISYNYCGDDYLNSSWSRSVTNLIPGMIALMILVGIVGGVYYFIRLGRKE